MLDRPSLFSQFTFVMGNMCGVNLYQEVKEKYGNQFQQYVVGDQVKALLADKISNLQSSLSSQITTLKNTNISTIENQQNYVTNQLDIAKQSINLNYPGGVKSLQQMKGTSVQAMLGYHQINEKFNSLKQNVAHKFAGEEKAINADINLLKENQSQQINSSLPDLPLLNALKPAQQQSILEQGQQDFKQQIQAKSQGVLSGLSSKLDPQTYLARFSNILPLDSLNSMTTVAKSSLQSGLHSIIGGTSASKAVLF